MHTLFTHVEHSAAIADHRGRAVTALQQRFKTTEPMRAVLDDPDAAAILPQLGFRLCTQPRIPWQPAGPTEFWEQPYMPHGALWGTLSGSLSSLVTNEGLDDGCVRQCISAEAVEDLWTSSRDRYRTSIEGASPPLDEAAVSVWTAALLASLPGPAWIVSSCGSAVERTLPAQPLRYAPSQEPLALQLKTGLLVHCLCWVVVPPDTIDNPESVAALVYFSGVGGHKRLKAFWATLQDRRREILRLPDDSYGTRGLDYMPARRPDGKGVFDTFWNDDPLPESGLAHMVIQHRSALRPRTGQAFLYVTGIDETPDLQAFFAALDIASPYPLQPEWASRLWYDGLERKLLVRLPSRGCAGFWVRADDPGWAGIVSHCAGGTDDVVIETIGEESGEPLVAAVMDEAA